MLKGLESEFREWDDNLEIHFKKGVLYVIFVVERERNIAVEENSKSFLLLQLAVFLLRYHCFSAAGKATPIYIILKEL